MSGKKHTDGSPAAYPSPAVPYPWLVYTGDEDQIFYQISPSGLVGSESRSLPELQGSKVIYCSPDGRWLLLLQFRYSFPTRRISIWNPVTKESIELPHWTRYGNDVSGVLSCSPDDPNCVVYLFMEADPHQLGFCRVGDKRWSIFHYEESIEAQTGEGYLNGVNLAVSLKGNVYGLLDSSKLVAISVDASNNCTTTVLKGNPVPALYHSFKSYLVPWEDRDLYLITTQFPKGGGWYPYLGEFPVIVVLKFSFSTSRWNVVPSLNGGAVFLDAPYSLASSSYSTTSQGKWSFLYYNANRKLYSYRMEDGKVTSYAPCPRRCDPCWIMPANHEEKQKAVSARWNDVNCFNTMEPCSKKCKALGNGSKKPKVVENGSASTRWNDVNCFSAMKPCSKKRKVLDNDADCSKIQKVVENVSLCDLLPELLEKVAEKVSSFVEYTYFLNINKLGSDVARRRENKFRPCLIYRDNMETSFYHIIDSSISREVRVEISQRVRGKSIGCCRDGWLLVEDFFSCCLYNPLTQKVIETIGCNDSREDISNLTFIRSPDKKSSVILAMYKKLQQQGSCLEPGDSAEAGKAVWWKLVVKEFVANCNSPVLLGEDWFYLNFLRARKLGRLRLTNMDEGKFEWEVEALECPCKGKFDKPLRCFCRCCDTRNYLTECGGELLLVFVDAEFESGVRVFKVCGDTEKEWEEIDSLGGYCLYLDSTSCISCVAETLDVADRIYFPKFYKDGLVYYSLKTLRYHSIGNEQDEVRIFNPITMFTDCTWIIPDFSLDEEG